MLKIRGLKKTFGNTLVLKGVDLDILEGEIVVVVGPSGGGKTTLLRIIISAQISLRKYNRSSNTCFRRKKGKCNK